VYIGNNALGRESFQVLKEKYLAKRGPAALTELKLVGCDIGDRSVILDLLSELNDDFQLRTLSLSNIRLE